MRLIGYVTKCSHSQSFLCPDVNSGYCEASKQLSKFCVSDGDLSLTIQFWKLSRTQHVAVLATKLLNGVFQ